MAPFRVLVIEDDCHLSRGIELALATLRHIEVRHASCGQHAATLAASDPPDLILLDLEMPPTDGSDTLRRLRANDRTARTPIVGMAESRPERWDGAATIDGCNAHLLKPFASTTLRHTVRSFLPLPGAV
jgi:two-component system cell cycle response regulator DivK